MFYFRDFQGDFKLHPVENLHQLTVDTLKESEMFILLSRDQFDCRYESIGFNLKL